MRTEKQITNQIFELGSKYQLELVTKGQALEVGQSIADDLTNTLELEQRAIKLMRLEDLGGTMIKQLATILDETANSGPRIRKPNKNSTAVAA